MISKLELWNNTWQNNNKYLLVVDDRNYYDILLYIYYFNENAKNNKIAILVSNDIKYKYLKYLFRKTHNVRVYLANDIDYNDIYAYINVSQLNYNHIKTDQFDDKHKQCNLKYNIKTCLSFYNENNNNYYNIAAKNIYDYVLNIQDIVDFSTTDNAILSPLSNYIYEKQDYDVYSNPYKLLSYLFDIDIVIACDNITAQCAILLGKYTIIIADQRYRIYQCIKHKNCVVLNINDKNLYVNIGKNYRKFIKQIERNIYDNNMKYYNRYSNNNYQIYKYIPACFKNKKYYTIIWLLKDIQEEYINIEILDL